MRGACEMRMMRNGEEQEDKKDDDEDPSGAIDEEGGQVDEIEMRQHAREAGRRAIQEEVDDIRQVMKVARERLIATA